MGQRFTDEQLEAFYIDPTRPTTWATCPHCGGLLVMGYRKDTGNLSLAHESYPDPERPGAHWPGCEPFRALCERNPVEFLRLCKSSGVHWQKLVG
jgi:hypothetical protein